MVRLVHREAQENSNSFAQLEVHGVFGIEDLRFNGRACKRRGGLEGFADGVVKGWPDLADQLAGAVGPGAVGEQDDGN